MRYRQFIGLLAISTSFVSCSLFKASCTHHATNNHVNTDSVSVIYSDSVDSIIMDATKVRIYDMADFVIVHDSIGQKDSLFNYEIKKDIGLLEKDEKIILLFIVSDKNWYIKNYAPIRQPFHPNIALEFISMKRRAFMFVSFGTEEIAISDTMGNFKFYQMYDKRPIARWAYLKFPKEDYYKELIKP